MSKGCPANFSMLYLSMSWSLASIGSDLGMREVDIKGGTERGKGKPAMGLVSGGKWLAIEAVSWLGVGVLKVEVEK